ncbi:MAG TPA: cytochrome c oxidase subunit 3 [Phenylobacterium sp.]|jgi:cytochrome c oxidase subunit 3|nr:cytochrome c oxidase subunit 3 [Phenylobacterium sp.]
MAEYVTLAEQFAQPRQQREADFMGMYVFLGTETMLFGGLLALVYAYRVIHPQASAEAARHLKIWIATANTAVLLTSSLAVAFAVLAARHGKRRIVVAGLIVAMLLGMTFLGLKGWEYLQDFQEGLAPGIGTPSPLRAGPAALFFDLYFVATTLHAVHLTVGLGLMLWAALVVARRRVRLPGQAIVIEMTGLYWHFVDIVWVFVFPIFYLARG